MVPHARRALGMCVAHTRLYGTWAQSFITYAHYICKGVCVQQKEVISPGSLMRAGSLVMLRKYKHTIFHTRMGRKKRKETLSTMYRNARKKGRCVARQCGVLRNNTHHALYILPRHTQRDRGVKARKGADPV